MTELSFRNTPEAVMQGFMTHPDWVQPVPSDITSVANIIDNSYVGDSQNAYGVCRAVAMNTSLDLQADCTNIFVVLFHENHELLPERWKSNSEIKRTILTMIADIDLGFLRALQSFERHEGGNPYTDKRIAYLTQFRDALQEQNPNPMGESGGKALR